MLKGCRSVWDCMVSKIRPYPTVLRAIGVVSNPGVWRRRAGTEYERGPNLSVRRTLSVHRTQSCIVPERGSNTNVHRTQWCSEEELGSNSSVYRERSCSGTEDWLLSKPSLYRTQACIEPERIWEDCVQNRNAHWIDSCARTTLRRTLY